MIHTFWRMIQNISCPDLCFYTSRQTYTGQSLLSLKSMNRQIGEAGVDGSGKTNEFMHVFLLNTDLFP